VPQPNAQPKAQPKAQPNARRCSQISGVASLTRRAEAQLITGTLQQFASRVCGGAALRVDGDPLPRGGRFAFRTIHCRG